MIEIGGFQTSNCRAITRRCFVQASFALPLGYGLANAANENPPAESATAKSIILLWLWGGPSHIDTFDPKPKAPIEIRGPYTPIATRTPGLRFSELFPRLATRSHLFSVVRTNVNLTGVHRIAGSIALTGGEGQNGDDAYGPNFGSIVQRTRADDGDLPPFVSITQGELQTAAGVLKGFGGGRWGSAYDPFPVKCSDRGEVNLPTLKLLEGLGPRRLADRERLLREIDVRARFAEKSAPEKWRERQHRAFRLLTSNDGRRALDLSLEPERTRGKYGRTSFGQSCLLARRLVEAEVPYIQVNWSKWVENIYDTRTDFGWDTHWLNFEHLTDRHGPILDRALSALLDDLHERGLLDSTLVVTMGEFGRTPKISGNGGRDHWHQCYSSLWAGGGVRPGRAIGESDSHGNEPLTQPITPAMVGATMLELSGVRAQQRAELRVLPDGTLIDGLL
ncbi:MAG: DUF1501 domain-containing protein [Planctomycetes bacterium]|nr:DUF1501 domain-containing protein [Planctomycetota bacterium]